MIYKTLYNKIPLLLEEAYQHYYSNTEQQFCFKTLAKTQLFFHSLYERLFVVSFQKNYEYITKNSPIIKAKFTQVIQSNSNSNEANNKIAAYFFSAYDHNGVYSDTAGMAYQFYEIKNLQAHGFTVYPHLVHTKSEIDLALSAHPADLLYIAAHGSEHSLTLHDFTINDNLRFNLKTNATIILSSCSTAKGLEKSLAEKVAKDNPGTHVFGATNTILISNINFADNESSSHIKSIEYQAINPNGLWSIYPETMHKFCFVGDDNNSNIKC